MIVKVHVLKISIAAQDTSLSRLLLGLFWSHHFGKTVIGTN